MRVRCGLGWHDWAGWKNVGQYLVESGSDGNLVGTMLQQNGTCQACGKVRLRTVRQLLPDDEALADILYPAGTVDQERAG